MERAWSPVGGESHAISIVATRRVEFFLDVDDRGELLKARSDEGLGEVAVAVDMALACH